MTDPHNLILERLRQNETQRRDRATDASAQARTEVTRATGMLPAGTRVLDLVTGLEGEVIHAARENVVVPTA